MKYFIFDPLGSYFNDCQNVSEISGGGGLFGKKIEKGYEAKC